MTQPIASTYDAGAVRQGLRLREPVVYRDNGNRSTGAVELLGRLEQRLPLLGITRVADISQLTPHVFPVFQSSRPGILTHIACGQNTGSQGKGRTALQAKISCLMEEVESFCCEPVNAPLIRGSYRFLRQHQPVISPRRLTHNDDQSKAAARDPLMWIPALSLEHDCELLVPAETVLFPFCPQDYRTRSFYPCSTNGVAAGGSYLEAVLHALYEVVERCYLALYEVGAAVVTPIAAATIYEGFDLQRLNEDLGEELSLELFAVQIDCRGDNLPMVICHLRGPGKIYGGYGLSASVEMSIDRAVSEALQAYCVDVSGSREDLDYKRARLSPGAAAAGKLCGPGQPLSLAELLRRVIHRDFDDLHDELLHLTAWVHRFGFPNICVANLTRVGIDVPVVRAVVPGLPCMLKIRRRDARPLTQARLLALRYGFSVSEAPS